MVAAFVLIVAGTLGGLYAAGVFTGGGSSSAAAAAFADIQRPERPTWACRLSRAQMAPP